MEMKKITEYNKEANTICETTAARYGLWKAFAISIHPCRVVNFASRNYEVW